MAKVQSNIKHLEGMLKQIGSEKDNKLFRQSVTNELTAATKMMNLAGEKIDEFREMKLPGNARRQQLDQYRAFKENQQAQVKKLQLLGQKIQKKQIEFAELADKLMHSYNSNGDDALANSQLLMQQFNLSDEDLKRAADADYMANIIGQRKEDINNIATIMSDINAIA